MLLKLQNITRAITMELKVASKARQRMTKRKLRGISAMSSAASSGNPNMQVRGDRAACGMGGAAASSGKPNM